MNTVNDAMLYDQRAFSITAPSMWNDPPFPSYHAIFIAILKSHPFVTVSTCF